MSNNNILGIDLLTPGSVWLRENNKKNFVLFVTNTILPIKTRSKHPIQVVYCDEQGNILNQNRDHFLETRTFYNGHFKLEQRLLQIESQLVNLFAGINFSSDEESTEDSDDATLVIDDDADQVEDGTTEAFPFPVTASVEEDEEVTEPVLIFTPMEDSNPTALISAEVLGDLLESYSQEPQLQQDLLLHKLIFRNTSPEVAEQITRSFSGAQGENNTLFKFTINPKFSGLSQEPIEWDQSCGAYPYLLQSEQYLQVIVASSTKVVEQAVEIEAETEVVIEAGAITGTLSSLVQGETVFANAPAPVPDPSGT